MPSIGWFAVRIGRESSYQLKSRHRRRHPRQPAGTLAVPRSTSHRLGKRHPRRHGHTPQPPTTNARTAPAPPATLLGHLPYPEAPATDLVSVTPDGSVKLRTSAAAKYQEMANAAAASGIYFAPISGFRSLQDQQHVFFDVKAERRQNASKRAEVSAPPGYSEHHTGYAIDIGDGSAPENNLSPSFENTQAFKWLEDNAVAFSFEMSFPKNNRQGVSYEPWHWRFVGDKQSLETFYKAHSMKK